MRAAGVLAALAVALLLQSTLAGLTFSGASAVNLILVAVVYVALSYGAVTGVLAGTAGGLAQDALSGGIIGIGGLSKTVVGFFVGVLGSQFIVSQPLPRFVMFFGATLLHELIYQALSAMVEARGITLYYSAILTQAAVNASVGIVAFQIIEMGPGLLQRRPSRRGSSLRPRRF